MAIIIADEPSEDSTAEAVVEVVEELAETIEEVVEQLADTIEEVASVADTEPAPDTTVPIVVGVLLERVNSLEERVSLVEERVTFVELQPAETIVVEPEPEPTVQEDVPPATWRTKFHKAWFGDQ